MPAASQVSAHYARIGRMGGSKTSPAKRHAARLAALARWGHGDAAIATTDLTDGCWYGGEGRNANMGLWDARKKTFWVTCITDSVMPSTYPTPGPRSVRLKREKHIHDGGTFRPLRLIR